jgi:hypothetical protein
VTIARAVYWDTSALLKLYAPEADSGDYIRLLIQQPEDVAISCGDRYDRTVIGFGLNLAAALSTKR